MLKPCQGPPHVVSSLPACPPAAPPSRLPAACLDPRGVPQALAPCAGSPGGRGPAAFAPQLPRQRATATAGTEQGSQPTLLSRPEQSLQGAVAASCQPCSGHGATGLAPRDTGEGLLGSQTRSHTRYGATGTGHCNFSTSLFTGLQTGASKLKYCDFRRDIYTAALSDCW